MICSSGWKAVLPQTHRCTLVRYTSGAPRLAIYSYPSGRWPTTLTAYRPTIRFSGQPHASCLHTYALPLGNPAFFRPQHADETVIVRGGEVGHTHLTALHLVSIYTRLRHPGSSGTRVRGIHAQSARSGTLNKHAALRRGSTWRRDADKEINCHHHGQPSSTRMVTFSRSPSPPVRRASWPRRAALVT